MPDADKIEEFLDKLKPCIDKGELDACVDEAVRLAEEMEVDSEELLESSAHELFENNKFNLSYVLALTAEKFLIIEDKWRAYILAGFSAQEFLEPKLVEKYYHKAVESNPERSGGDLLLATHLFQHSRLREAEEYIIKAIHYEPNNLLAHAIYSFILLVEYNKLDESKQEMILVSKISENNEDLKYNLIKAVLYSQYSEKNIRRKHYQESSEDAFEAGNAWLKVAKFVDKNANYTFELKGNEFKAKSFIRKEHRNLKELIENLKDASEFYKNASVCQVDGKQELCGACHGVMDVFSQVLTALDDVIKDKTPSINKDEWHNVLETSMEVYHEIDSNKGADLVDALEQLIKCVDELYEFKVRTSTVQGKRLKDCYNKLIDVSSKVEGGLKNVTDPASDIIKDYAGKKGIPIFDEISPDKLSSSYIIKKLFTYTIIILGAVGSIIAILQFLQIDTRALEYIKSLIQ